MNIKEKRRYHKKKIINQILRHTILKSKLICWYFIKKTVRKIPLLEIQSHLYITGKTGSGKSSFMEQWIYYHRRNCKKSVNKTIIVLDPHGDTVEKIRRFNLAHRNFDSLIYIDPAMSK